MLVVAADNNSELVSELNEFPTFPDKEDLSKFNEKLKRGINRIESFIDTEINENRKIAGYGAGGRGVMTLASLRNASQLEYLCDQNQSFHGKFLPKSKVPVKSIEELIDNPVDTLLVFSYGYMDEITKSIKSLPNAPQKIVSLIEVL
nr:hypothetical protein [Paenibacillus hamazuiensis]